MNPGGSPATAAPSVFDAVEPRFDEQAELGRGGMGRVAEAVDRVLDRTVAIKYSLATDDVGQARFEREVRITAQLQHPAIVPILDTGRDAGGRPFYVMRKIDGVPLGERVARAAGVRERLALIPALLAAVDAAAYAHARGVVHRDIKPGNILLGGFGDTLLIDWGLARVIGGADAQAAKPPAGARDAALTRSGSAYGTPCFMSPEQARGEPAGPPADVYSLGATLYYVLAGAIPFDGVAPTRAVERVAAGDRPDLSRIPPEVPVELTAIARKALAAAEAERYRDAGELAGDLRRFLAGQLVEAHRYTARQRIARWIRAHRLVAIVAAVALTVLIAGATLAIHQIIAERDRAREARGIAEARADELLVDRARALVAVDPTSALAVLRDLRAGSPLWPTAREIVRAAMPGGSEHLIARHAGFITAMAFSPRGRLASASSAALQIHDLARRTTRTLRGCRASQLAWLDDRVVVCAYRSSEIGGSRQTLALVDVDRDEITNLPDAAYAEIAVDAGRLLVRTAAGGVQSFSPDGRSSTLAAEGVRAIAARAGRIAMLARDRLTVIERDGSRRELAVAVPDRIFGIRMSMTGRRVAALVFEGVIEWTLDAEAAPRRWPRSGDALNGIVYAGDRLYGWSTDGSGVVELEPGRATTRWSVRVERNTPIEVAATGGGAVFATANGALAYAGGGGVIELPHRPLPIHAISASETTVALGTTAGEVLVLDVSAAVPALLPLASRERLYAVSAGHLVVGREAGTRFEDDPPAIVSAAQPDSLAVVDLATSARTSLTGLGFGTTARIVGDSVVAWGGAPDRTLAIWELTGRPRYRAEHVRGVEIGAGGTRGICVYYETASGDLFEVPVVDPDGAQRIARFEPRRTGERAGSPAPRLRAEGGRLVVTEFAVAADGTISAPSYLVDARGTRRLELGVPGVLTSVHRSADGTWWAVTDYAHLWRIPPGGAPREIAPGPPIRAIHAIGDRIWAESAATLFEIASDGAVVRRTSNVGDTSAIDDGVLLTAPDGVAVVMPLANVRRLLRLPARPISAFATPDGRVVAALIAGPGGDRMVAAWADPVPADPGAILAYLGGRTNARMPSGSDELTWDARDARDVNAGRGDAGGDADRRD